MSKFNFQVNLEGMIDILSNHLYSEEKVFVRELLQNCTDAISARKQLEPNFQGEVRVEFVDGGDDAPSQLIFEDNGIGLNEEEVHGFLAVIGSSSKRKGNDLSKNREDFIGQFGIGLLSCFMITDEIVLITQSAKGGNPIEWRGNADGTYSLKQLKFEMEPGTKIYLRCKPGKEEFYGEDKLKRLVKHYGDLLSFPIYYMDSKQQINEGKAPFEYDYESLDETYSNIMQYGKEQFGIEFFDYIPLESKDGKTTGVAFILPFRPSPASKMSHKVYLKRMLIAENAENILPDWAFFVKCILNSDSLRPTASRESFYEDDNLATTKKDLGQCLKDYIVRLAQNQPEKLARFIRIHSDTIKALALYDNDFFDIIIESISFPSTMGHVNLSEFLKENDEVLYIPDLDEFRQVAGIATAQGLSVINAGYIYDADLLKKYGQLHPELNIKKVSPESFIHQLDELDIAERNNAFDFLNRAEKVLNQFNCQAEIKKFNPTEVPTLYSMDKFVNFIRTSQKTKEISDDLWSSVMDDITQNITQNNSSKLCFNYNNPLIQKMVNEPFSASLDLFIKILYVQSLLLGMHPLNKEELKILNGGLLDLLTLGTKSL